MGNALYTLEYDDLNYEVTNHTNVKLFVNPRKQVEEEVIEVENLSDLETPSPNFEAGWSPWELGDDEDPEERNLVPNGAPFDRRNAYGSRKDTARFCKDSIIDNQATFQTTLYRVKQASYYRREKHQRKWQWQNVIRMLAGIPFAVMYGVALYLMLRFIFIDPPEEMAQESSNDSLASINGDLNDFANRNMFSSPQVELGWADHRPELIYGSVGFTVVIGTVSIFSRGTCCSMLLMLPCLITGRSRAVLFTFIAGLLVDGPVTGIVHNFNEISKNTACVYGAVAKMAKSSIDKLNEVSQVMGSLRDFIHPELDIDLSFPCINALQEKIVWMKEKVAYMKEIMSVGRKVLTGLSLALMVYDSISYLRCYYTDNSFDNKYINRNVRQVWANKKHPEILPLRNWEKNEGYKSSSECLVKKREFKVLLQRAFSTVLFTVFAVFMIAADYLLWKVVIAMKEEETMRISVTGPEEGLSKSVKRILATFLEETKFCGVNPTRISMNSYILISVFLIVAMISCIFEVLISRLRSRMCNIFYTDRAQERADYLHFRISAGRVNRKTQLVLIIKSNAAKEKRMNEFLPWTRFSDCGGKNSNSKQKPKSFVCPGCEWDTDNTHAITVCLQNQSEKNEKLQILRICRDCNKDYRPVTFHRASRFYSDTQYYFNDAIEYENLD